MAKRTKTQPTAATPKSPGGTRTTRSSGWLKPASWRSRWRGGGPSTAPSSAGRTHERPGAPCGCRVFCCPGRPINGGDWPQIVSLDVSLGAEFIITH
jgi:hypothetical protein